MVRIISRININPFKFNGLSYPINWTSPFPVLGVMGGIFVYFYSNLLLGLLANTCADQEKFVRGGPTATFLFIIFLVDEGEGGDKYHHERAIIGPPAKRHLNGASFACR